MTSVLSIEGKEYTQATLAAKHFGYTKDYLLLLIKDGKIDGKKVGNKWYVFSPSVEDFFNHAKTRKEERRKQISDARKRELTSHTRVRFTGNGKTALVETLGILVVGLALGVTGYVGTTAQQTAYVGESAVTFFERFAISLYTEFGGKESGGVLESANDSEVDSRSTGDMGAGLIVAPEKAFTKEQALDIASQFSDPVTVTLDSEHPQTGIITPEFKSGDGEGYRFLMVPVNQGAE